MEFLFNLGVFMSQGKTLLSLLPALLLLSACGNLSGVAPKSLSGSNLVASNSGGTANSIVSFTPAAGTYTNVPSTVQVNFNTSSLDPAGIAAISTYSITCGGNPLAAQSVTYTPGFASVSVSLPSFYGLAEGTSCVFSVSISLKDGSGNYVSGTHTVGWTISASGQSTGTGTTWNESATTSYTGTAGNNAGSSFMGVGGSGMVLSGLLLNGGQYVNGIAGLWSSGFASTSTSTGPVQGASAGGFTQVSCPAGYRMTGVFGQQGPYVDQLGIICKTQDQSQTYTSSSFGTAAGTSFTLSCPAGQFATDLDGMSDGYLEQLYLGCR